MRRIPEGAVRDAADANKKEPYETYRMRTVRSPECINMVVSVFDGSQTDGKELSWAPLSEEQPA